MMRQSMVRTLKYSLAASLILAAAPAVSFATPYASNISIDPTTKAVTFILNQPSTTLKYSINGGTPVTLDGTTVGTKTFNLGSLANKFSIIADNTDAAGYSVPIGGQLAIANSGLTQPVNASGFNQIGSDTNTLNMFNSPRGVAVSNNPNAANFGTTYVSNSASGGTTRTTGKGIYAIHADGTDAYGYGDTAQNPNTQDGITAWTDSSSNSPFRLTVGPTGDVVAANYASASANVYYMSPNLQTAHYLLTGINGTAPTTDVGNGDGTVQPAHQYHGSIEGVAVEGSLGQGNLVIHTLDEQLTSAHVSGNTADNHDNRYSIWKYSIGGTANVDTPNSDPDAGSPFGFTGKPTLEASPGNFGDFFTGGIVEDMDRGADGKLYYMQSRSAGGEPGIVVTDPSGTKLFDSLTASRTLLANPTANDILTTLRGMAVSPDQKWLAAITNINAVVAIPLISGIPDLANMLVVDTTNHTGSARDIGFDAADNIVYVSSGQGLLRTLALGGHTTTTLTYDPSLVAGSQFGFALSTGSVGLAGDYNGDGKVDAADYVTWRNGGSPNPNSPADYNTWRANFGNHNGSGSGLGGSAAVPEPASLALLAFGLVAVLGNRRSR